MLMRRRDLVRITHAHDHAVAPGALRRMQRLVGAREESAGAFTIAPACKADADGGRDALAHDRHGLAHVLAFAQCRISAVPHLHPAQAAVG